MSWTDTQKIRFLFVAATLIPVVVLAWLGGRILRQERDVERQRARERLEVTAARFAINIDATIAQIEEKLGRGEGIRFTPSGFETTPDFVLLYQPQTTTPAATRLPSQTFVAAETEEFQKQNLEAAAATYEKIAAAGDPATRAAALAGLARVLRRRGDTAGALRAYEALKQIGSVRVEGELGELIARLGRAKIFQETGASSQLRAEAEDLQQLLYSGKLSIDRATFGVYADLLEQWAVKPGAQDAVARTEAAIRLWEQWRSGDLPPRGRRLMRTDEGVVLTIWQQSAVSITTPEQLQAVLDSIAASQRLSYSISDLDGQPVAGRAQTAGVSLTPGETRLPFILKVTSLDLESPQTRIVLFSGLILAAILTLAAGAALHRVTMRELLLARQQSDFVSAVSHEFRTPLTSMRHLTDLLASRGVASEERKAQYYELLAHETERLHRMVEGLLSFGRIEAGAYAWQLEPADLGELISNVVEEFRREPDAAEREIVCHIDDSLPPARVDREALSRALWNLLENAAKYSERGKPIHVFARRYEGMLLAGVEDRGSGIEVSEQSRIFQKFVRGSDAKRAGIRGVGIGLALVQSILEAHGGSVRVESVPGRGSTFTLVIPCHES